MNPLDWLDKSKDKKDLTVACFILIDLMLFNLFAKFFTSYMNHPINNFSNFDIYFFMPIGVFVSLFILLKLIIFQIRLTRVGYLEILFKKLNQNK